MMHRIGDPVWVRRFAGGSTVVDKASIVGINRSCVLPYRLRFRDGEENQFHDCEFLESCDVERARLAA